MHHTNLHHNTKVTSDFSSLHCKNQRIQRPGPISTPQYLCKDPIRHKTMDSSPNSGKDVFYRNYLSIYPSIYLSIYNITFLAILIFWLSFCWRPAGTWHIFLGPPFCINRQVPRGGCLRWKPDTDSYTNWIGNGKGKNDVQTHYKILGRHIEI